VTKMMKASVVREFGRPLSIQDVPVPSPGPGEILVKVIACGVCHTDLHAADGDWPVKPSPPFIPGHEVAGTVAALGAGVTGFKEGDPVGVAWLHDACMKRQYCETGWETVCESQHNTGYSCDRPAFAQAMHMVRRRGTVALVGLPPGDFPTPIFDVVLKRITVRGSIVGTRRDLDEAVAFAVEGKVRADITKAPLEDINTIFGNLRAGKVEGRMVLTF